MSAATGAFTSMAVANSYRQKIDREMVVETSITTLSLRLILPCAVDREDLFKILFSEARCLNCRVIATVERRFDILTLAALPDRIFGPLTSDSTMEIVSIRPTISFASFHAKIASLELPASVEDWIHNCREHSTACSFDLPEEGRTSSLHMSSKGPQPPSPRRQ
jgi:hypothetical protein